MRLTSSLKRSLRKAAFGRFKVSLMRLLRPGLHLTFKVSLIKGNNQANARA